MAFEQAIAQMIREASVPDNYIVLQSELDWMKLYKAASDKNAILCIEFHEANFPACRSSGQHFLQLARKNDNLPFVQIRLTGNCKWPLVRKSVGGVDYIPCIVIMSFTNDGAERAKFEGEREIEQAIRRGLIQTIIDEFKERRELARNLEGLIAVGVLKKLVDDNQEKEEEVQVLKKKMEDFESERAREEEDREKRRCVQERREKIALEERMANRPIILEELKQEDDIESIGVRKLRDVFRRLHVNIVGLTEKHELLGKLYEELPELRNRQRNVYEKYNPQLSPPGYSQVLPQPAPPVPQFPSQDDDEIYGLSDQAIETMPVSKLKRLISKYGLESFPERSDLICVIKKKRNSRPHPPKPQNQNPTPFKEEVNELSGKIIDLTDKLTQTKILSICRLSHFEIVQTHQVPVPDKICQHTVRCKKEGLPDSRKLYTLKGVFNYFDSLLDAHTIRIINEIEILSTLHPHPNILYHCALIYDKPTRAFASKISSLDNIALFSVMESLPCSICKHLSRNHKNAAISTKMYLDWMKQLISAFSYLFDNNVYLRSIKHDNIMYDPDSNTLKLMGFDSAITSQTVPFYTEHTSIGDLYSYLAPEILNAIPGPSNFLDYSAHYSWTAGALSYDLACNQSPFTNRVDPAQYDDRDLPILSCIYPYGSLTKAMSSPVPSGYSSLVIRMLSYSPYKRPNLQTILSTINAV